MKIRFIALLLTAALAGSLLAGCRRAEATLESAGDAVENRVEAAGDSLKQTLAATAAPTAAITPEQAQSIALEHAGFTAGQVTRLHAEYETGRGIPHYDVEFHAGQWEYDYEIDAGTGEILTYEKDD